MTAASANPWHTPALAACSSQLAAGLAKRVKN
jgi:hypothetical protein